MCTDKDRPPCEHDDLIGKVDRLQGQVARLTTTIKELRKQLAAAQRAGKRQAAPFSKGERTSKPRRPGRKPGTGNFSYRKPPAVDELTEPTIDVAVSEESCPGCGGILEHDGESLAYVTDIPPMPRPQVTEYRVQVCRCVSCGRRVRGRHRDVGPDQYGASAHRVGRRVMAAAHMLHYGVGLPVRRVPVVLRALTGVELSQSAITQDALRRARGAVGDAYQRLRESVRESAVVHTDDTGWRVGGEGAFLMAFETDDATVYQVRGRHRNEEVREVVPGDYAGVMVTDRARSYDARALSGVRQQKCLAHVLRSISEVVQTKVGRGRSFGKRLSELLREAMQLRESERRGEMADYAGEKERLRRQRVGYLAHVVGQKRAREIWMLTQQYSAQQALEMGLANSVVPHDQLRDETIRYCKLIKNNSPVILQLQKITFNESAEYLEAEPSPTERYASDYPETEESEERRLAFIERRPINPDKNLPITPTERQASLLE